LDDAQTFGTGTLSTVYGMLLSLVGEVDRYKHCGVRLAFASLIPKEQ
jgi:CRISPR-associated protein Cas5t